MTARSHISHPPSCCVSYKLPSEPDTSTDSLDASSVHAADAKHDKALVVNHIFRALELIGMADMGPVLASHLKGEYVLCMIRKTN